MSDSEPASSKSSSPAQRGRQVTRALLILKALENSRRGLTVQELLSDLQLDCGERTVYRDLENLQKAGFSLTVEDHRYRLSGNALRSTAISQSHLLALLVAQQFLSPWKDQELGQSLASFIEPLSASLTPVGRQWVQWVSSQIEVTSPQTLKLKNRRFLNLLQEAIAVEESLEILYASAGKEPGLRKVDPHKIWFHGPRVYLIAYCHQAAALRTFALQRILDARLLEETFERRPDSELENYTTRGFGVFHGDVHLVRVRFHPEVAHLCAENIWHSTQQLHPQKDGSVDLSMTVSGLPEIAAWVGSFGGSLQALEPPELVELVKKLHKKGYERHVQTLLSDESC